MTHYVTGVPAAETVQTSKEAASLASDLDEMIGNVTLASEAETQDAIVQIRKELAKMEARQYFLRELGY